MYFQNGEEVESPDSAAGLYIRDRSGHAVKANIPSDHIAFQMGEAMQVIPAPTPDGNCLHTMLAFVKCKGMYGKSRLTMKFTMQTPWPLDTVSEVLVRYYRLSCLNLAKHILTAGNNAIMVASFALEVDD